METIQVQNIAPKRDNLKTISNIAIAGVVVFGIVQIKSIFGGSKSSENAQSDIKQSDDYLKQVKVEQTALRYNAIFYKNIADNIDSQLQSRIPLTNFYLYDFSKIYNWLSPLNKDELKKVAKEFGTRQQYLFLMFGRSDNQGTIFEYFEFIMKDTEIAKLKLLFSGTGVWGAMPIVDTREAERLKSWKPFTSSDIGKSLYSFTIIKAQTMGAVVNNVWYAKYTTIKFQGFGAVAKVINIDKNSPNTIYIEITDTRAKAASGASALKSRYWVNSRNWLKVPPPNNDKYPL